ncbi:hypothetical protein [Cellulomonas citrea]|uniref:hypothetical protein n=1 Tax=Cellulomonas citrea TaxID=1909423 RepID=UPI00135ABB69|nr:hypothetical protein [Cellulomonas citrea]
MTRPALRRAPEAARRRRRVAAALTTVPVTLLLAGCVGSPAPAPSTSSSRPAPGSEGGPVTAPATPGASAGAPASPGQGTTPASESLPGFTAPTGLPGLSPAAGSGSTLTGPAPSDATAQGSLVAGFPSAVVPVPDGVEVVTSSVSGQGTRVQAALLGSSAAAPADVQAAYAGALAREGFAGTPTATVDGSTAVTYSRGVDGVVVSVRARLGGGTELSVLATLTTTG